MNDREMLEYAAKAAGKELADKIDSHIPSGGVWVKGKNGSEEVWNPRDDDGDAFRLAVKLELEVDFGDEAVAVRTQTGHKVIVSSEKIKCSYAAARRAIVMASAAEGKTS